MRFQQIVTLDNLFPRAHGVLRAALTTAMAAFGKLPSSGSFAAKGEDEPSIFIALRHVSLLPLRFFPDELAKPIPSVRGKGSYEAPGYLVEYPGTERVVGASGRVRASLGNDGVSLKYRIPYSGRTKR